MTKKEVVIQDIRTTILRMERERYSLPISRKEESYEEALHRLFGADNVKQWKHKKLTAQISLAYPFREVFLPNYGYAIPTAEVLQYLVKHSPFVEMGAGLGYWAYRLRELGGKIDPYDKRAPKIADSFVDIYQAPPDILSSSSYAASTLLLIWPHEDMARECLNHYKGNTVCYIGEGFGETCAGIDFQEELLRQGYSLVANKQILSWPCIHDSLFVFRR